MDIIKHGNIKATLFNEDCLTALDLLSDLDVNVDAVITDPPYGTTQCKWDSVIPFDIMWEKLDKVTNKNTPIILFGAEPFSSVMRCSNIKKYKYDWIWEKTQATGFLNAKKQPMRCYENIMVFYSKQPTYNYQKTQGHKPVNSFTKTAETANKTELYGNSAEVVGGGNTDRYPRQIIKFKSDKQTCCLHSTQKPLALMEYLIKTYTNEGDTVLDFTFGSCTTGLACIKNNRNFIGSEINPVTGEDPAKYYKVGLNRLLEYVKGDKND